MVVGDVDGTLVVPSGGPLLRFGFYILTLPLGYPSTSLLRGLEHLASSLTPLGGWLSYELAT